ncbi:MAG TPA: glycosyltransferase 87 family protein, partial [Vicinamibacteria bacterium]|nr:glycosyltransferase 87 family protein [Vicinamibacteria bacterium]
MSTPGHSTDLTGARLRPALRPGLDAAVVPGLLLLLARELVDHDPPRVLAWRLLHEPRFAHPPAWLRPFYPDPQAAFDRDPVALLLAACATGLALVYLTAALARASTRLRLALIAAGSLALVVVPTVAFVALGAAADRPYGQDGGVVQLPLALEKILKGESPYGADYSESVLGRQARASTFWEPLGGNPILRHHAYLPGTHLVMLPGYLVGQRVLGVFDPRLVTLLFYGLAAGLAFFIPKGDDARLAAVALAALNPLTWWQQVFGANDVMFVAMILLAVLLARQERAVAAAAVLGLACATKQLAWPFAPFLLAHLSGARSLSDLVSPASLRRLRAPLLAAAGVFLVVVAPVAALDLRAFYGDIVKYNVGLPGGDNYPLGGTPGFGFANFLIGYGGIQSLKDYFPFGVFYLLLVPLGFLLLSRQLRWGRAEGVLVTGSAALFASLYFSRVVHANYLIPLAILLPLGVLALRLPADVCLAPLALGALAVAVSEQELFRATFDEAVAARVPEALAAWARALLPHPAAGLTVDPIGLVVSATCGAFGLLLLVAGVLQARAAWRIGIAVAALLAVVALPKDLVTAIGARTGTPRGVDGWVAQVPADAARLAHAETPYAL